VFAATGNVIEKLPFGPVTAFSTVAGGAVRMG
jgi:hypothetical protein